MKSIVKTVRVILSLSVVMMIVSCAGKETTTPAAGGETTFGNETAMLNIRYIDKDSLLRNYNLAKDLNEALMRTTENFDNIQRQKASEIQKFAAQIENKYKTNGYLSEASFNADQQKLQKMQVDAQNYLANLERSIQDEMLQNNIQLNDSVNNFIKDYNAKKGYEIIFDKAAAIFINDKYDITAEVIEGLNERYNKVGK